MRLDVSPADLSICIIMVSDFEPGSSRKIPSYRLPTQTLPLLSSKKDRIPFPCRRCLEDTNANFSSSYLYLMRIIPSLYVPNHRSPLESINIARRSEK